MRDPTFDDTERKLLSIQKKISPEELSSSDVRIIKKITRLYRAVTGGPYILFLILFILYTVFFIFKDIDTFYGTD